MFQQVEAPLKVLDHPSLGDGVLTVHDPQDRTPSPLRPSVAPRDLEVMALQAQVFDLAKNVRDAEIVIVALLQRVERLEAQTLRAQWGRLVLWLRSLWPWP